MSLSFNTRAAGDGTEHMNLFHYYEKGTAPFRNAFALPEERFARVVERLQKTGLPIYKRYTSDEYIRMRQVTETWLYDQFVAAGGKPGTRHPVYCTVERSEYFEGLYNGRAASVTFNTVDLAADQISFTYPDSMASLAIARHEKGKAHYNPELHGRLFMLDEITQIIERHGMPDPRQRFDDPTKKHTDYIEAQVWVKDPETVQV